MMANQDFFKLYFNSFPPGYRFKPTDEELIEYYLKDKILKRPLPPNKIKDLNIYQYSPQELYDIYLEPGEGEMYFFTLRNRKHPNGSRPNRSVAKNGFWNTTGSDKPVGNKDNPIGFNRSLAYYHGGTNKGSSQKTDWLMHEYTFNHKMITSSTRSETPQHDDKKLVDWVLCKVYKRKTKAREEDSDAPSFTSSSARADETGAQIERLYTKIELELPNIPHPDAMYFCASSQMLQDAVSRPPLDDHAAMSFGNNTQSTMLTMPTMPYFDAGSVGSTFKNTMSMLESNQDSLFQNNVQEYSSDSIWPIDEEIAMVSGGNVPNYQA